MGFKAIIMEWISKIENFESAETSDTSIPLFTKIKPNRYKIGQFWSFYYTKTRVPNQNIIIIILIRSIYTKTNKQNENINKDIFGS